MITQMDLKPPETSQRAQRTTVFAFCGLAGALIFGLLPISHWLVPGDSMADMLTREAIWWGFALAILLWLSFAERLPLSSIGVRTPTGKSVIFGVLTAIVVTMIIAFEFAVLIPRLHLDSSAAIAGQQAILKTPYWYRVLLVLRAAVVEEILFRGYLIEKVRQLSGSTILAVIVSVGAFTYAHLRGWGTVHLIAVGASGIVFALLYVWRRDLPSNMLGHFLADALGFLTR
jgi:membrane protease YdiL (CAAX protease family)